MSLRAHVWVLVVTSLRGLRSQFQRNLGLSSVGVRRAVYFYKTCKTGLLTHWREKFRDVMLPDKGKKRHLLNMFK